MRAGFLAIEDDPELLQVDRIVEVDIPRGALPNGSDWREIANCVQHWLRSSLAFIPDDTSYGETNLGGSVEKALRSKLPKLVATRADVRILMLERAQFRLDERDIWLEPQRRRSDFPLLDLVTEIWFAETVFYDSSDDPGWRDAVGFHLYNGTPPHLVADFQFFRGVLTMRSRDGVGEVMPEARSVLGG